MTIAEEPVTVAGEGAVKKAGETDPVTVTGATDRIPETGTVTREADTVTVAEAADTVTAGTETGAETAGTLGLERGKSSIPWPDSLGPELGVDCAETGIEATIDGLGDECSIARSDSSQKP